MPLGLSCPVHLQCRTLSMKSRSIYPYYQMPNSITCKSNSPNPHHHHRFIRPLSIPAMLAPSTRHVKCYVMSIRTGLNFEVASTCRYVTIGPVPSVVATSTFRRRSFMVSSIPRMAKLLTMTNEPIVACIRALIPVKMKSPRRANGPVRLSPTVATSGVVLSKATT